MELKQLFLIFAIAGLFLPVLNAQKFGHINSALIIEGHPKIAEANTQLETFQKILSDSFNLKAKDFEARYLAFVEQSNSGALSPVLMEAKKTELIEEQNILRQEEQQLQFRMLQRREQLLQPILTEVDGYIQAIGKEGNFTMIFDTSVNGALLFAAESEDITEVVKGKCMAKQ